MHLTWFDAADADGQLSLDGLAASSHQGLMLKIKRELPAEQIAVMDQLQEGGRLILTSVTGQAVEVCFEAADLDIPRGSPVIMRTERHVIADAAQAASDALESGFEKVETRSQPCPDGQAGEVMQRRRVVVDSQNGDVLEADPWENWLTACQAQ